MLFYFLVDRCVSFTVGSNILNCKTKSEWKEIGQEKCATENTDILVLQAMKVTVCIYMYLNVLQHTLLIN